MTHVTTTNAATVLRDAVAALSDRLTSDFGDLVPDASTERTAAVMAKLEGGATSFGADDVATLDSWIRLADSAMLHDDTREAGQRSAIGERLRAVRALVAPGHDRLTEDSRELPDLPAAG